MGIRIQPREIEIPAGIPFQNDLLGREEPIKALSNTLMRVEGPCVLALDAAWGTGKTTFLNLWKQYLHDNGFAVVKFNAWENDFIDDPFIAVISEITEGFQSFLPPTRKPELTRLRKYAMQIGLSIGSGVIRLATQGVVDPADVAARIKQESLTKARFTQYREIQQCIHDFRQALTDIAKSLRDSTHGLPLVLMIDELDRCRPSYAIELLEIAKHLFSVDDIVFVLAVNRSELAHSIKVLYGEGFDAEGYLRRFFDIDIRLPEPERGKFIRALLGSVNMASYFSQLPGRFAQLDKDLMEALLLRFLDTPAFSLRRIAQAIYRIGLVLVSLPANQRTFASMAALALILRTVDPEMYYRFLRNEDSDKDVVDRIFRHYYPDSYEHQNADITIAAMVIVAGQEEPHRAAWSSPLLDQYREDAEILDPVSYGARYAKSVIQLLDNYDYSLKIGMNRTFQDAARSLDLISPNLIDEQGVAENPPA